MTTFGVYNNELEVNVKFRQLTTDQCQEFLSRYGDLPKKEYILNVLSFAVANIESEVRPALAAVYALSPQQADETIIGLFNGCIMLNPVLDVSDWEELRCSYHPLRRKALAGPTPGSGEPPPQVPSMFFDDGPFDFDEDMLTVPATSNNSAKQTKGFSLTKAKLNSMQKWLKARIIGQNDPIDAVHAALCRYQVGLNDPNRPIGVFIFLGPSGVGKTLLAKYLHDYLFDNDIPMVRIDCGEYQHKHENQKLIGSPAGYTGYEDGGFITRQMAKTKGATVVLLDEIEKAHKDFWNTWLKAFDDGYITDAKGNNIDFRNCVFILTSNLGNDKISEASYGRSTGFTSEQTGTSYDSIKPPKREMVVRESIEALYKYFSAEFMGRIDEAIVFNHLTKLDFRQIADLEFKQVARKLAIRHWNLEWTPEASDLLVENSSKAMSGARSMAKARRAGVETPLASLLVKNTFEKGTTFKVDVENKQFTIT